MKVLITRRLPGEPEKFLRKNGFKVSVYKEDKAIPRKEFLKKSKDVDAVLSLLTEKIDQEVIDNFSKCKIVANCAVGYNNIDVTYAKKKNLVITNTPYVLRMPPPI
jgi:glyoxylate reductase